MPCMSNVFYRLIVFLNRVFEKDYHAQRHLAFYLKGCKPIVTFQNHKGYTESVQKRLDEIEFNEKNFEEKVTEILRQNRLCNYVRFTVDDKFVQFWTGDGELTLDFPMSTTNKLDNYYYEIMGVLAETGFLREYNIYEPECFLWIYLSNQLKFRVEEKKADKIIKANFRKNFNIAAYFTAAVFQKI